MGTIALGYAAATHPGMVRQANEDTVRVDPARGFALVADGVGGARGGATASGMTAELVHAQLADELARIAAEPALDPARGRERLATRLGHALAQASLAVHTRAQADQSLKGMATTCVVAQVLGSWVVIGHVGDSRVYLVRGGKTYQLTEDHSLARDLMNRGVLTAEQAANYPHNVLIRSVGLQPTVKADVVTFELAPDDVLVLCSDGLPDMVADDEIGRIAAADAPDAAAAALIARANGAGGRDNVSVALVRVAPSAPPVHTGVELQVDLLRHVGLFRDLSFQEAARVLAHATERRYPANAVVFREGEPGDRFYLISEGAVVVSQRQTGLTTIERGGHFGELALITDAVRSATVETSQPTTLLSIERDAFVHLVRDDHALAVKLLWGLLRHLAGRVKDLSSVIAWTQQ